jgi:protein TonB
VLELTEIIPNTEMVAARRGVENSHGKGAVGVNTGRGEGTESRRKEAHGGGGGGQQDKSKAQVGNIPPPSPIPAMIPKLPPVQPIMLPTAGVDLDKALYRDMKYDRFGDPISRANDTSAGPGRFGGIGSGDGTGIGKGDGPGVGPGSKGNTGGRDGDLGSGEPGLARDGGPNTDYRNTFRADAVTQKARILSKPEPQYTEEARKNQITGTVVLRAVLGSGGEVTGIRAVSSLPYGLTEKAIAAARQIKFTPAVKDGHAVSQYIQIEYNFNLY